MKRLISITLAAILALSLFVSGLPVYAQNSELTVSDYYGRNALSKMARGSTYVAAYDCIYNGAKNGDEKIDVSRYDLSLSELDMVLMAYLGDPTGHFWFTSNGSYEYDSVTEQALYFYPIYNSLVGRTDAQRERFEDEFEDSVDAFIDDLSLSYYMSDYEKELAVHDKLAMLIEYDFTEYAHSAYGALLEYIAVCEGYTYAFGYILAKLGILSHAVYGSSRGEMHTWNLVKIDGDFYYVDLTWNDQTDSGAAAKSIDIYYEYFNVTTQTMCADHSFITPAYGLPACTATKANYFTRNPQYRINSQTNAKSVAALWSDHAIRLYFDGTVSEYSSWLNENLQDIVYYCGYDLSKPLRLSTRAMPNGHEYHLFFEGTLLPNEEPDVLPGDLDDDGKRTAVDSNVLRRIVSGQSSPTALQKLAGDMDSDGSLTSKDSNLLKRLIAGS